MKEETYDSLQHSNTSLKQQIQILTSDLSSLQSKFQTLQSRFSQDILEFTTLHDEASKTRDDHLLSYKQKLSSLEDRDNE